MLGNAAGGIVAYYIGIAIVALPGLIGVILIGRLHRAAIRDCQKLQDEVSRAEHATGHIRCLLSDLMATMNLSLALCASKPDAGRGSQFDEIRLAAEEAIKAHHRPVEVGDRAAGSSPRAAADPA